MIYKLPLRKAVVARQSYNIKLTTDITKNFEINLLRCQERGYGNGDGKKLNLQYNKMQIHNFKKVKP